jgi:hypothetical protein
VPGPVAAAFDAAFMELTGHEAAPSVYLNLLD